MAARNREKRQEEAAFCSLASRLCPQLDESEILRMVRQDAAVRRARVRLLRNKVRSGVYRVHPGLVAVSLLVEDGFTAI
jgi:anti-sigma28 factor (negative regulator of flagellin synthesis)